MEWRRRLKAVDAVAHPAYDLYAGEHWRAIRDAYELSLKFSSRAELWVISAGHGLIAGTSQVKAYSATFSSGVSDSVWRGLDDGDRRVQLRKWWAALPHEKAIVELFGRDAALVVAAGAPYVDAVEIDLDEAARADATEERVSLISAGTRGSVFGLPVDGRLRRAVGGTDNGLNARILLFLAASASEHRYRRSKMAALLADLAQSSPATERRVGKVSTDENIRHHLSLLLDRDPTISRTRALALLREGGIACEQSRFAALWQSAA